MYILPSNKLTFKVSFHYTILGVMLDKIQFVEALTLRHTIVQSCYQKVYTYLPESVYVLQKYHFTMQS